MKITIVSESIKLEYSDDKTIAENPVNQYNTIIETQYNVDSIIRIINSLGTLAQLLAKQR